MRKSQQMKTRQQQETKKILHQLEYPLDISSNKARFVFDQCQCFLENSTDSIRSLDRKGALLLAIVIGLLSFLSTQLIMNVLTIGWYILIALPLCFIVAFLLYAFVHTMGMSLSGRKPNILIQNKMLKMELNELFLFECANMQTKIDINMELLLKKSKALNIATYILISMPIYCIALWSCFGRSLA